MAISARFVDGPCLGNILRQLHMPVLSNISLEIRGHADGVDEIIDGMCSAMTRCPNLREFTLDTTAVAHKLQYRFGVLGMFINRLSFLEKVTFRGAGLYDVRGILEPPLWHLFHFEGAASGDMASIRSFVTLASRGPKLKLRICKWVQFKEISALRELLGGRLEYEAG
ncbi:hypothetical protein BD410DRAFT_794324 [Rickenella mellea]|uniref:F-box domain-containing protein n=1 Tax=Rickenella mellea TaxID=50990 RepID=A0A4Y7PR58_9AGAM|nr:hypothetical protein BD410DRAFT_794324 [Rickenella mellea]